MNRLLEDSMVPTREGGQRAQGIVPVRVDVYETDEDVVVKSDLPGVKPEDVDISYSENTLTIKGQFQEEKETERENVHIRERRYGSFQRSVALPTAVKAEEARAEFEDGVLRVTLPKTEEQKPKRIEVKMSSESHSESQPEIESKGE
jgi:HSP20 family protein